MIKNEDCIEGMKKIEDGIVDIIIADPPYNIGKDFGNNSDKQEMEQYLRLCDQWIRESIRILDLHGSLFIYGFSENLAYIFTRIPEIYHKKWLIWNYQNKNTPTNKFWDRSHESIIQVSKEKPIFNLDDIRVPYSKDFSSLNGKVRPATSGRFGNVETKYNFNKDGAKPRDVIQVPALAGGAGASERFFLCSTCNKLVMKKEISFHENHDIVQHPTQKPRAITEILIKSSINKNKDRNLVVIPFAGSGSECFVAKTLNCDFIGFEINKEYVKMGNLLLYDNPFSMIYEYYDCVNHNQKTVQIVYGNENEDRERMKLAFRETKKEFFNGDFIENQQRAIDSHISIPDEIWKYLP